MFDPSSFMINLLHKISQLNSVQEVLLLSLHGEPLYAAPQRTTVELDQKIALWNSLLGDLERPLSGEFLFANGRYCLQSTGIGAVIIGMASDINLKSIRGALVNAQEKLVDPRLAKKVLLKMLGERDFSLLPCLVNALVDFADEEVASALTALLDDEAQFPEPVKDRLLLALCNAFAHCPSPLAIPALNKIQHICHHDRGEAERGIELAAVQALRSLATSGHGSAETILPEEDAGISTPLPEEQHIWNLLEQQQGGQAIARIMELVTQCARARKFQTAERLRDWLIQIDPSALTEVIRAAEIIEQAKSAAVDPKHATIWRELAETLSHEEFVALYHVLRQREYAEGQMVAAQGQFLPLLFFVNQGRLELYALSQGKKVALQVAGAGDVIGRESFFEFSVWTVNVVSLGAEVAVLSRKSLESLQESHPTLHAKLFTFCGKFLSANSLFRKTRRTRRQFERIALSGKATIELLDRQGQEVGTLAKGRLLDISRGGVAVAVRFTNRKNAEDFLGGQVSMDLRPDILTSSLACRGKVVALRCQDFVGSDYSIHVELTEELDSDLFEQLAG